MSKLCVAHGVRSTDFLNIKTNNMKPEQIKDFVSREVYGVDFSLLTDSHKVGLIDTIILQAQIEAINEQHEKIMQKLNA